MNSLYKGNTRFDREQLIFVAETALIGALDRIESCLPNTSSWEWRKTHSRPRLLIPYERAALEAAGMSLSVLYAQLTDDGLGIYDALQCADQFEKKCEKLVSEAWKYHGRAITNRLHDMPKNVPFNLITDVYDQVLGPGIFPDTGTCAQVFVDHCFDDYLRQKPAIEWSLPDGGTVTIDRDHAHRVSATVNDEKGSLLVILDTDGEGFPTVDVAGSAERMKIALSEYNAKEGTIEPVTPAKPGDTFNRPQGSILVTLCE